MPPPSKPSKQRDADETEMLSNNLWVGNLAADVTESELMGLFGKHGALDSITSYSSRNYAFVYFKRVEDAKAAKDALRGMVLHGIPIKIEFAKPAKPCKSLWVGGIGPTVSKEELEEEFLKFGKIEDFKFIRERNTAFVDYLRLEDAAQALKNMNGKRLGGEQIRVDFLRSQPSRREQWPDFRDKRDGQFLSRTTIPPELSYMPQDLMRNFSEPTHSGAKRQYSQLLGAQKGDGQPSNVLWIGYPPSVHIDEQMLHNALILFGEIERIKSFPERHYSFVEFRSVEEARRAKEGLQGKLFNDPRITIAYSSRDLAPNDFPGVYQGIKGPRPDMVFNELPFHTTQMDILSQGRPMGPNGFPGPLPPRGTRGADMLMRPLGPQGSFDSVLSGPEFSDLATLHKLQDTNPNSLIGAPNWRRSSPAPGILSSPSAGIKPPTRSTSSGWDVFDASQLQRESKRSRIDSALPVYDAAFPAKKMEHDHGLGLDQLRGHGPQSDGGSLAPLVNAQWMNRRSPVGATGGTGRSQPDHDYIWRGMIAKGGTPVCRARCVPVGEGIGSEIPEVVNCSARTGLDMLTKHYADAVGFSIVFFLPDSEEDFASYTEFLRYLGAKDRAGVAKFDDGTTLFLVPPSDFLTKVLNIVGPPRLYGVVLKFQQHAPSSTYVQQESQQSQYVDKRQISSAQTEYGVMPQEERILPMNYNGVLPGNPKPPQPLGPTTSNLLPGHSAPQITTATVSQAGVTLTPELIATLASLLPASGKLSGSDSAQPPSSSLTMGPSLTPAVPDNGIPHGWKNEHQAPEQSGHLVQQSDSQFNSLAQLLPQLQAYPTTSNGPNLSAQGVTGPIQIQDPSFKLPQEGAVSSRLATDFTMASQSGQFLVSPQVSQQYQPKISQDTQTSYGPVHGMDCFGLYGSPALQQPTNPVTLSNPVHSVNVSQSHASMVLTPERVNSDIPNQVQQLQSTPYGAAGQDAPDDEVDKNERYQSTLRFAANLLFQIQQQQQPSTQAGQGSGTH